MKYYLHDTNSFHDEKITLLFQKFGYEGLGLFYTFLEKIAAQEQPINTDVLKFQLKVGKRLEKCWKFMESIELLSSNNGETFNKQLLNFSEKFEIKKEKNRKRVAQWRENEHNKKSVTRYVHVRNAPKVKESKVNSINTISNSANAESHPVEYSERSIAALKYISEKCPTVAKMKMPLTHSEADKLIEEFGKEAVKEILNAMENYVPLLSKSKSANLTIRKWLKKDQVSSVTGKRVDKFHNGLMAN